MNAPLTHTPAEPPPGSRNPLLSALGSVPALLVLAALVALAWFGHEYNWDIKKFQEGVIGIENPKEDETWCKDHAVPKDICVVCKPDLIGLPYNRGFCERHGVHNCPFENPDVAQPAQAPAPRPADLERFRRATALLERPANKKDSEVYLKRIQLASEDALKRAGVETEKAAGDLKLVESLRAPGEIVYDPTRVAHLAPRLPGSVVKVLKKVGDTVKEGETVALIDAAEVGKAKAAYLQAYTLLEIREKVLERLASLVGITPEAKLFEAQGAAQEARANLLAAEQGLLNLGFQVRAEQLKGKAPEEVANSLRELGVPKGFGHGTGNLLPLAAPLDGVLVECDAVAGEVVDQKHQLAVVADVTQLWLSIDVRLEDARLVKLGQKVIFQPDGGDEEIAAAVAWISTSVDERTRTLKVRAAVPNGQGKLFARTFGAARLVLREETAAIAVPEAAVHFDGGCHLVFVRDRDFEKENNPYKIFNVRTVRVGARERGHVEILAGLRPGEVVATRGSAVMLGQLLYSKLPAGD